VKYAHNPENTKQTHDAEAGAAAARKHEEGVGERHEDDDEVEPAPAASYELPEPVGKHVDGKLHEVDEREDDFDLVEVRLGSNRECTRSINFDLVEVRLGVVVHVVAAVDAQIP
jgi:hypothetical protein